MKKKTVALLLALVMVFGAAVGGTIAYLTSTDKVENTFTVGKVAITLDEAKVDEYGVVDTTATARVQANDYKLIPGHTYTKDPTVHVDAKSEDCWVFAKIENGLSTDGTLAMSADWTVIDATKHIYAYKDIVKGGESTTAVFNTFTFAGTADPADYKDAEIVVTGYAVQADGFTTAQDAWTAAFGANNG